MSNQAVLLGLLALLATPAASGPRHMTVYLRGRPQAVRVYDPAAGAPRRNVQVLVTSGDLGWLGISGDVPVHLQKQGYRVIGLNSQSYLASFTGDHGSTLKASDIAGDYDTIMQATNVDGRYPEAFVSIGVSEGAGTAVIAMGQRGASPSCIGVIGLGLPQFTELGWRWTDFPSWITKAEPHEPLAPTVDYMARLQVPVVIIHSIHDEYDSIDTIRTVVAAAPSPHKLIPVDAPNHRFTHHVGQVLALTDSAIAWMESLRPTATAGGP